MLPDIYQAECERIANQQAAALDDAKLHLQGCISQHDLNEWRAIVGLRNRIVHDYLNVDPSFINGLILQNKHHFIADFLRQKIGS